MAMLQPGGTGVSHRGNQNVDQQPAAPEARGTYVAGAGAGQGLDGIHGGATYPETAKRSRKVKLGGRLSKRGRRSVSRTSSPPAYVLPRRCLSSLS